MSLSVGTLNLKFMQRGAAKSGAAIPEALPRGVLAAEQEARWVLPRRTGANASASTSELKPGVGASVPVDGSGAGPSRVGGVRVSYESSYVPFISPGGGGGRMKFGGFGQAEEQPEAEGKGEGEEDDDGEDAPGAEEGEDTVRRQVAVRVSRRVSARLGVSRCLSHVAIPRWGVQPCAGACVAVDWQRRHGLC